MERSDPAISEGAGDCARLPDTYSNLGTAYFYLKNYDQATKMYEKAVEMTPNDEELLGNLGDAYRWSGHSRPGGDGLRQGDLAGVPGASGEPAIGSIMSDLGLLYAKKGDAANAVQYTNQARAIKPDDVQLMYSEAQVKTLIGKPEEALKSLKHGAG